MAAPAPARSSRRRRVAWWVGGVLLLLALLTLDLAPAVPAPPPPRPEQVEAVRGVARTVRNALNATGGRTTLVVDTPQMAAAAVLVSRLDRVGRVAAQVEDGTLRLTLSRRLIGPIWLNGHATVLPTARGFPPIALRLGRLPLGRTLSGWVIRTGASLARRRGIKLPPLDTLVRSARFDRGTAVVAVTFPLRSGLIDSLPSLQQAPVDAVAVRFVYCRLIRADARAPVADLATVVARAFAPLPGRLPVREQNRARFVALAMYAVSPAVGRLAPDAQNADARCPGQRTEPMLVGRADLAKHWTLSAALAVTLGEDVGRAMGEWKELADSRPADGEGFSFVDLAADRAGLAAARRGADAGQADAVAARLRGAREDDLLPLHALALSEGLSEAQFIARYRNVDSRRFGAASARIDRVIAQTVGR